MIEINSLANLRNNQHRASKKALATDNLSTWLATRHANKFESKLKSKSLTQKDFDMWLFSKRPRLSSNPIVQSVLDDGYDDEPLEFWLGQSPKVKRKVPKVESKNELNKWLCQKRMENSDMQDLESGINDMSVWLHESRVPGSPITVESKKKPQEDLAKHQNDLFVWLHSSPCNKAGDDAREMTDWSEISTSPGKEEVNDVEELKSWLHSSTSNLDKEMADDEKELKRWLHSPTPKEAPLLPFGFEIINSPLSRWRPAEPVSSLDEKLQALNLEKSEGSVDAWLHQNKPYLPSSSSDSSDDEDNEDISQWLCVPENVESEGASSIAVIDETNSVGSFVFSPRF